MKQRLLLYIVLLSIIISVVLLLLSRLGILEWNLSGSRYVSWLPSFSVEVSRARASPAAASQLDAMARQLQQVFPQFALAALAADLAHTRSPDLTVENILAGRLLPIAPPPEEPVAPQVRESTIPEPTTNTTVDAITASGSTTSTESLDDFNGTAASATDYDEQMDPSSMAVQFEKSAAERESMLQRRKEQLVAAARRRYLQRQQQQQQQQQPLVRPPAQGPPRS